jgi:DNA-binding response OmpR family regulator
MIDLKPAHSERILIVDDILSNVLLLERMLSEHGYTTQSVPSGKLALAAARASIPDLILLDINMPTMSGYDVCRHLKNDVILKDIPVIFVSGLYDTIDRVVVTRLGGADYITKPFHFGNALSLIQNQLQLRRNDTCTTGKDKNPMTTKSVYCIATTLEQAGQIADQIKLANFSQNDISVLFSDKDKTREFSGLKNTKVPEGAHPGEDISAGIGGIIGGAFGP